LHRRIAPAYWRLPSLDHLVGADQESFRDIETDRVSGLEIDNQLEAGGHLDWQIARLLALEDLVDQNGKALIDRRQAPPAKANSRKP
jgi:hypothetical protein